MIDIINSVVKDTPHFITPSNDAFITNLGNFVKTVDANNLAASQQYSKIEQMLAQMDVNDGDKHIIEKTKQQLNDKVNEYSTMLGNGTSINALIRFEGDMLVNPELKQAVINQQKWRTEEAALRARQDLPENMKEWWINKYKYTGIKDSDYVRDENGNVTIKEWNEPFKLAEHVQDAEVVKNVVQILNQDSFLHQTQNAQIVTDENGNQRTVYKEGNTESYEYLSYEKVANAFLNTILGDERMRISCWQEYLYDTDRINLKAPNANESYSAISNDNAETFAEWILEKFNGRINAIVYARTKELGTEDIKGAGRTGGGGSTKGFTFIPSAVFGAGVTVSKGVQAAAQQGTRPPYLPK